MKQRDIILVNAQIPCRKYINKPKTALHPIHLIMPMLNFFMAIIEKKTMQD
jgi:hypothetical protein